MSLAFIVSFICLAIRYGDSGCHDIYLLESAVSKTVSRFSEYGRITNVAGGKCLDISYSEPQDLWTDGQSLQIYDCDEDVVQQQWKFTENDEIQNEFGLCLDVHEPAWENNELGARVQLWRCIDEQDNQKWDIDGETIKSSNGMCLDIGIDDLNDNGGVLQLWDCQENNPRQIWNLNQPHALRNSWWDSSEMVTIETEFAEGGWAECPEGYAIAGFHKQSSECRHIGCIDELLCHMPSTPYPELSQTCRDIDIKLEFDDEGAVSCPATYFIRGIYSSGSEDSKCDGLSCLETLRCCQWDEEYISVGGEDKTQNWRYCFDDGQQGWCEVDSGRYVTALYRDKIDYAERFAPLLKFDSSASKYGYPMNPQVYIDNGRDRYENNELDTKSNPTYYRIERCGGAEVTISYWWFYGDQHGCMAGESGHAGDWEEIIVTVDNFECSVKDVTFYQHAGYYRLQSGQFEQDGDTTIVYVGKVAHGSYYDYNNYFASGGCGYYYDWRSPDSGADWLWTYENLIELNPSNTDNSDDWIKKQEDICCSNPFTTDICDINGCDGHDCSVFDVISCDDAGCNVWFCDDNSDLAASDGCCIGSPVFDESKSWACPPTPRPVDDGIGFPCQPWPACEPI